MDHFGVGVHTSLDKYMARRSSKGRVLIVNSLAIFSTHSKIDITHPWASIHSKCLKMDQLEIIVLGSEEFESIPTWKYLGSCI